MADLTVEQARYYLAAMIDGEGLVYMPSREIKNAACRGCRVAVYNTDPDIIRGVAECLTTLGVRFSIFRRGKLEGSELTKKYMFQVIVQNKLGLDRLYELDLPIRCKRKKQKLEEIHHRISTVKKSRRRYPDNQTLDTVLLKVGIN